MSALRGSVLYTSADPAHAIFGLGIDEDDVLDEGTQADVIATAIAADESSVTSIASALSGRVVTVYEPALDTAVRVALVGDDIPPHAIIGVQGIETDDVIMSAFILRAEVTTPLVATAQTLTASVQVHDVKDDATITEDGEVTFKDMVFDPESALILTYMDLTPDTDD